MVRQTRLTGLYRIAIAAVALALAASPLLAGTVIPIYVKADAAGANNGTSWTDAYLLLESALAAASSGDEIWVAAGTYKPTSDYGLVAAGDAVQARLKHFRAKNGVGIYGGFAGTETARGERNWTTNVTTLSGDIGVAANTSDNSYHVFYHPPGLNLINTAVVDGFTITGGNANTGGWPHSAGGGMFNYESSAPTVTNCTFSANAASSYGGGMCNHTGSSPTVTNCAFSGNSGYDGGGMSNYNTCSPTVTNCTFSGNSGSHQGGGMRNYQFSAPTVKNCTFSGNSSSEGGGMRNYWSCSPAVTNCVLWGNAASSGAEVFNSEGGPAFSYCDIAGCGGSGAWAGASIGTDGGGNIDSDPLFVNAGAGDCHLAAASPCIDSANGPVAPATDKDGNARHDDTGMPNVGIGPPWADMGAYEFQKTSHVRIYVKQDATGANTGVSWADAFVLLQSGLDAAGSSDEIWVAAGTYKPTSDYGLVASGTDVQDRLKHFRMKNGVGIYGGFAGTEGERSERNWTTNVTILSGDPPAPGNSYHVFYHDGLDLDNTAVLDGFTITDGTADGESPHNNGGGMYNDDSSPTVTNCTFSGNSAAGGGGGMHNDDGSSPTVTNCAFSGNSAANAGGGMSNDESSPTVTNCVFSGNSTDYGGGIYSASSSPAITNCTFSDNSADYDGGGVYNDGASPAIVNCVFSGNSAVFSGGGMYNFDSSPATANCSFNDNSASQGGGMYNWLSSPVVTNCILWGDSAPTGPEVFNDNSTPVFSYCDVQGGYGGTGNVNADPLFVNAGAGDYHLAANSPCIDSADGPAAPATDKEGSARHDDPGTPNTGVGPAWADMGAYEFQGTSFHGRIYVKADAAGADTGVSWADAFVQFQSGLDAAVSGDEIWVAAGTYKPTRDYALGINDREKHFEMKNGVGIYGGFAGTETLRSQRNWASNVVTLSGDIGVGGDADDNCYHVFNHQYGLGLDGTAVLDGFAITGGQANGDWPHGAGGGMLNYEYSGSPTVTNCTFSGNWAFQYGGGMCNVTSSPTVTNCVFSGNWTGYYGGGMSNGYYSFPAVTGCAFSGNSALSGGGMFSNENSSPAVTNCVFSGNSATDGGGMYNSAYTAPSLTNCAFGGNSAAQYGGGMFNHDYCSPSVTNCVLWGDSASVGAEVYNFSNTISTPAFRCCDIAGSGGSGAWAGVSIGTDSGGNIDADPLFANVPGGNLRLQAGSPCIDAADGDAAPDLDKDGSPRVDDPTMANTGAGTPDYTDIGAYEHQVIVVTFPSDSGIRLELGKTYNIAWTSSLPKGAKVKVELVKGGDDDTWALSVGASKSPLKWTVGKVIKGMEMYPDGDDYRIRVSTLNDSDSDESDSDFAIGAVESLAVTGSTSVTGGSTAQYTCIAHYAFGADRDVTNEVKWSCSKIKGVKMGKTGLLTTAPVAADQNCTITAAYGKGKPPMTDTLDVTITP